MKKKLSLYAVTILLTTLLLVVPIRLAYAPPLPWFMKPSFPDYAPSGMPDFDQRQGGTYLWQYMGAWSHCGPVAVANSLWWLDSEFEDSNTPPPTSVDHCHLVKSYFVGLDDHDPANVQALIEHLAYLMDTDGLRTHMPKLGTNVNDMQAGITQYLSWAVVNPLGDVDGDGSVTANDAQIINNAMGTSPGMPGWDIRADIFPVTTTYPPFADNVITSQDLNLTLTYMGASGEFYEHTAMAPLWDIIVQEVLKCQDVVLLIAPYVLTGSTWYRYDEDAHFVTVAGLNATTMQLVISNPINDNAEAGGPGDVPVPHVHTPPEPPYITHNNASLVSHDMYQVINAPPGGGGPLALMGYSGSITPPPPGAIWEIETAVITSLKAIRDIAVLGLTVCYGQTCLAQNRTHKIYVRVSDQSSDSLPGNDIFTLTLYWNMTNVLGTMRITLGPRITQIFTFYWYTNQTRYWKYALSAVATPVCGETDTADNTFIGPTVKIVWPGDVDGDRLVSILDVTTITGVYGSKYPNPLYKANGDIDDTGDIGILDVVLCTSQYARPIP